MAVPMMAPDGKPKFKGAVPLVGSPGCVCCCIAGFSVEQTGSYPNFEHEFTDTSTASLGCVGGIVSWEWDFGDGATSTETNPVHEFPIGEPGPWLVTLTVTDDCGCVDQVEMEVHRIVTCESAHSWAHANIDSFTYAVSGITNNVYTDCGNLNLSGTTDTHVLPSFPWIKEHTITLNGNTFNTDVSIQVLCGPFGFGANDLVAVISVSSPPYFRAHKLLGTAPTISTAVFNSSFTADQNITGTANCTVSGGSAILTPNL